MPAIKIHKKFPQSFENTFNRSQKQLIFLSKQQKRTHLIKVTLRHDENFYQNMDDIS